MSGSKGIDMLYEDPSVSENSKDRFYVPLSVEAAKGEIMRESLRIETNLGEAVADYTNADMRPLASGTLDAYVSFSQIMIAFEIDESGKWKTRIVHARKSKFLFRGPSQKLQSSRLDFWTVSSSKSKQYPLVLPKLVDPAKQSLSPVQSRAQATTSLCRRTRASILAR